MARDLTPRHPLIQNRADRRDPLPDARSVGVLEAHQRTLLSRHGSNAGAHEPRAEYADLMNRPGLGYRGRSYHSRVAFQGVAGEEEKDELPRHRCHGHFAEEPSLRSKPGLDALRVSGLHRLQRRKRRGIMSVRLLEHAIAGFLEHHAPADRVVLEKQVGRSTPATRGAATASIRQPAGSIDRHFA